MHWTGDNESSFEYLRRSIVSIFNFNLFGAPFVGDDVCGFDKPSYPELCARWF